MSEATYATCKECGTVHFQVSRKYAKAEVTKFNKFYKTLTPEVQKRFYGGTPSNIKSYEKCITCSSNYKTFRKTTSDEIPLGSTINPIIARTE